MLKTLTSVEFALQRVLLMQGRREYNWAYANIGRPVPGIAKKLKGFAWRKTGQFHTMTMHEVVRRNGKPVRETYEYQSPIMRAVDLRVSKSIRMQHRVFCGLPAHP